MGSNWEVPWPLVQIDREDQLRGQEITLSKLHTRYGTFTSRRDGVDRVGRKKIICRVGKQTDLGDIEINLWKKLLKAAIEESEEKPLYRHLFAWELQHNYAKESREEVEEAAMDLFAGRIFDNPFWADFVPFNRKYRPDYLASIDMVTVVNTCCSKPYQIPSERYEQIQGKDSCCEHCGRHTSFKLIGGRS